MEALVATLADHFESRGIPLRTDPKRSIFRIYRDTLCHLLARLRG